jgi:hypothetical protein
MQLMKTGMPGYFQITAEGDQFKVIGNQIHQNDTTQVEHLVSNLADMLDHAIVFADDPGMVDEILDAHGLKLERE